MQDGGRGMSAMCVSAIDRNRSTLLQVPNEASPRNLLITTRVDHCKLG